MRHRSFIQGWGVTLSVERNVTGSNRLPILIVRQVLLFLLLKLDLLDELHETSRRNVFQFLVVYLIDRKPFLMEKEEEIHEFILLLFAIEHLSF